jgi:hypothetical protein
LILAGEPFARFMQLSDWLYEETRQTHKISLGRLFELLHAGLTQALKVPEPDAGQQLWRDFQLTGIKKLPTFAAGRKRLRTSFDSDSTPQRQARHAQ